MKASGDCPNLNPQPISFAAKAKSLCDKDELELNNTRLLEMKKQMKEMKERIKVFSDVLQREMGDDVDIKDLLRQGRSSGWQNRAQMVMTLRTKLIAMRSKFLDPPHKMFYRGPFDPKKEFDLKFLPEKQQNLYQRLLEEKKKKTMQLANPVAVLQKEFDDLSLMYRASRFRTKSLIAQINVASKKVEESKEKAETDLNVIEAMMAHQSLFKMMIEPETFRLDPALTRHVKVNPLEPPEIAEWAKFKCSLNKSKDEKLLIRIELYSLTGKLDGINKKLVESYRTDVENRLCMELQNASLEMPGKDKQPKDKKAKDQTDAETEYRLLSQENQCLRQFLISSVMFAEQDFKLFTETVDVMADEFINKLRELKEELDESDSVK